MSDLKIFAKTIEPEAQEQVRRMAESEAYRDCKIRIMPDCHAGKGCTIGTVIQTAGKVVPNTVGVDIGCGMHVVNLGFANIDLSLLDRIINDNIPSGFNVHERPLASDMVDLMLRKIREFMHSWEYFFDLNYVMRSLGTLGGGNHFIEVDVDNSGRKYLVIHSGSRNLGVKICKHFQQLASRQCNNSDERERIISELKAQGRQSEINDALRQLKPVSKDMAYISGFTLVNYYDAMHVCQMYAETSRRLMAQTIIKGLGIKTWGESFTTVHNYINIFNGIIRKGAVSAEFGEPLIIPLNMRDGSLLCIGKGNDDWLRSAPHGAGRLMSRSAAKKQFSMEEYRQQMHDIYSTSVCESTIDEAPMAYKSAKEIEALIGDTVKIVERIKPIYNFKAK
jgi:RNA-splicing ligase RtcB